MQSCSQSIFLIWAAALPLMYLRHILSHIPPPILSPSLGYTNNAFNTHHTHTHTHTFILSLAHSPLSCTLSSLFLTHTLSNTQFSTLTLPLSYTLSLSNTHTLTYTLSLSLTHHIHTQKKNLGTIAGMTIDDRSIFCFKLTLFLVFVCAISWWRFLSIFVFSLV